MKEFNQRIVADFNKKLPLFKSFRSKTEALLKELLDDKGIKYHDVSSRVKTKDSLEGKIATKQGYQTLEDITDIVGCRIITYFEDEVDRIVQIISKEFIVDGENSTDKRIVDYDRFGYASMHVIIQLNNNRTELTEYRSFKGLKFELQIRSILQHSWAEIEHDMGYKGKYAIPDLFRRSFSRIAALLELADSEFVRLRGEISGYEKAVGQEIKDEPENVTINQASLMSFIGESDDLHKVDTAIATEMGVNLIDKEDIKYLNEQLTLLRHGNIETISDLKDLYARSGFCIVEYGKAWRSKFDFARSYTNLAVKGMSLYDIGYYTIARSKGEKGLSELLTDLFPGKDKQIPLRLAETLFKAYNELGIDCK